MSNDDRATLIDAYTKADFHLIAVATHGKNPIIKGWQNAEPFNAMLATDPSKNVGLRLDGVVDFDFDSSQARRLASYFFEDCPGWRRDRLPVNESGHRLAYTDEGGKTFQCKLPAEVVKKLGFDKEVVCELRTGHQHQSVIPPSAVMNCDGKVDKLVWHAPFNADDIPHLSYAEAAKRTARLAFASVALAAYPGEGGRDTYCMYLAGALQSLGWDAAEADELILHLGQLAGDTERRHDKAARTEAKGEGVSGLPAYCEHIGCPGLDTVIRKWFGDKAVKQKKRAVAAGSIDIDLPTDVLTSALLQAMNEKGHDLFRRGDELVHVRHFAEEKHGDDGIVRPAGTYDIAGADAAWIRYHASEIGVRDFHNARGPVSRPRDYVFTDLIASLHRHKFRELAGLSNIPTVTRNEPGYDPEAKLMLTFAKGLYDDLPMQPTWTEAKEAAKILLAPVSKYEWGDEYGPSVFLAAVLTAATRTSITGKVPFFLFNARRAGSGKTKLAQIAGLVAGGGVMPPVSTLSASEEEVEKSLFAYLRSGMPFILLDNITHQVGGQTFEAIVTSEGTLRKRILGESREVTVSTRAMFVGTGNNVRLSSDMFRRTLICKLDPKSDFPEDRRFEFDPVQVVKENFTRYIGAAITLMRAYRHGPTATWDCQLSPYDLTGINEVRGVLLALGMKDPVESKRANKDTSPFMEKRAALFSLLVELFPVGKRFASYQISERAGEKLRRLSISKDNDNVNSQLGQLLSTHDGGELDGLSLIKDGDRWWKLIGEPGSLYDSDSKPEVPF